MHEMRLAQTEFFNRRGQYVSKTNLLLGFSYIVFGAIGVNVAHIIAGIRIYHPAEPSGNLVELFQP